MASRRPLCAARRDRRVLRKDVASLVMFFPRRKRGQWSRYERAMDAEALADLRRQRVGDFVLWRGIGAAVAHVNHSPGRWRAIGARTVPEVAV